MEWKTWFPYLWFKYTLRNLEEVEGRNFITLCSSLWLGKSKRISHGAFHFSLRLSLCSTFVCPTEIISFSDKANEFHDVNCEVVGVSVDSHFTHLAWINTPRKVPSLIPFQSFSHRHTARGSTPPPLMWAIKKPLVNDWPVCTVRLLSSQHFMMPTSSEMHYYYLYQQQ